jgi:hypothetical protein
MDAMDVDVVVDIQGAIMRLIEDPESVPAHELGLLGQVFAAIHPPMMMTFMSTQGLSLTPLLAAATATVGGADDTPDPLLHLARLRVLMQMEKDADDLHIPVGRGYSEFARAPHRTFTAENRVGELHGHVQHFSEKFSLFPREFDVLHTWVAAGIATLPRRKFTARNRLGAAPMQSSRPRWQSLALPSRGAQPG